MWDEGQCRPHPQRRLFLLSPYDDSMKLLLLGGTGGCGGWVARLAADRGHSVRAIVREGRTLPSESPVETLVGSVLDRQLLQRGLDGVGAVVSCLGFA